VSPPAAVPPAGSAQIREQEIATLKFRSNDIDVLENNRRIEVITQAEARRRIALGGYEPVGNNTVKYIRRIPIVDGPIDGPVRRTLPRAPDNFTVDRARGHQFGHRFPAHRHPWAAPSVRRVDFENSSANGKNKENRFAPNRLRPGILRTNDWNCATT
jgi:hypothetical protein